MGGRVRGEFPACGRKFVRRSEKKHTPLLRLSCERGEERTGRVDVWNGIDVLRRDGFRALDGQRIGLITNHTGLAKDGATTIDILHGAKNVRLTALFGPEHGIRGAVDEKVADSTDAATGLPVFSLYGETMRPKPEQLRGLDALVFDIQDVGCRYYTYISTLGNALEESAKAKLHLVVLDRPNPITGGHVAGAVSDAEEHSFTAWHPLPVRHGMTVGELARLFNVERKIGAGLIVVPCEGWPRKDWWDATGLLWTNPSPNMRSLTQATLYPAVGLLEFTNLSVGRGTDTPFELLGAPWLDGLRLSAHLNRRDIPGIRFVPVRFTPRASVHKEIPCGGINLLVTDRERLDTGRLGMELAAALRDLFPAEWKRERYARLLAHRALFSALEKGAAADALTAQAHKESAAFQELRKKYLLYV